MHEMTGLTRSSNHTLDVCDQLHYQLGHIIMFPAVRVLTDDSKLVKKYENVVAFGAFGCT
jgi:hypothetical protein